MMLRVFLVSCLLGMVFGCNGKSGSEPVSNGVLGSEIVNGQRHLAKLVGGEMVISGDPGNQQNPDSVFLPDKDIWFVTYEDSSNITTGSDIYGQFVNPDGTMLGARFVICNNAGNQTSPKAAYRPNDKIVVVWQDTAGNSSGGYLSYAAITNIPAANPDPKAPPIVPKVSSAVQVGYTQTKTYDTTPTKGSNTFTITGDDSGLMDVYGAAVLNAYVFPRTVHVTGGTPATGGAVDIYDDGTGKLVGSGAVGTVNYSTGNLAVTLNNEVPTPMTAIFTVSYQYTTTDPIDRGDKLLSRKTPKITYDASGRDQFMITWVESRDMINYASQACFGVVPVTWEFGDGSYGAYLILDPNLVPKANGNGIAGPDLIRNAQTSANRITSMSLGSTDEIYSYEYFMSLNNLNIASDPTSPEALFAWQGVRWQGTMTCHLDQNTGIVTSTFSSKSKDDGLVHIYGLFDKEINYPFTYSKWIDFSGTAGYNPSMAVDSVSVPRKFLVAWEDGRDGLTTKIFGQLVYSGGDLYKSNLMIGFQDLNSDGVLDQNVKVSNQSSPYVSYDAVNQRYFVAWQDGRNGTNSDENLDIFGQYVDLEGSLRGSNYSIATAPGSQLAPVLSYNSLENQFLAVWKDARNFATPAGSDIYGQRFSLGQPQLTLLNLDNSPLEPSLVDFGSTTTNQFATKSFIIKNTGDTPINIDFVTPLSAPFSYDNLPSSLAAQDSNFLTLVPSAQTTLTLRFSPQASGTFTSSFTVMSDAGNSTVTLQGSSVSPDLTIQPSGTIDFGSLAAGTALKVGQQNSVTFSMVNNGTLPYNITSITGLSAPFSIQGATMPISMNPADQKSVTLTFAPTQMGNFTGQVLISTDKVGLSRTVNVQGEAVAPILRLNSAAIDFGAVNVNSTKAASSFSPSRVITVYNDGNDTLSINSASSSNPAFVVSPLSSVSIPPGGSSTIDVSFAPNVIQQFNGTLTVNTNAGSQVISVTGQGSGPLLLVTPNQLDFGIIATGQSKTLSLSVSNTGNAPVSIASITSPLAPFSVSFIGTGTSTLLPGTSTTILVSYQPLVSGSASGSFVISSDSISGDLTVNLQGAAAPPNLQITPNPVVFSQTAVSQTQTLNFAITNSGQAAITVSNIDLPQAPFTLSGVPATPFVLAPGQSAPCKIQFAPSSAGSFSSSLGVLTDVAPTPTLVHLSGSSGTQTQSGVLTFLGLSGSQITSADAGGVFKGSQSMQTLTVKNSGTSSINVNSVTSSSPAFTDSLAPFSLAANEVKSFTVSFLPTSLQSYSGNLTLVDSNNNSYQLSLTGSGVPVNLEQLSGSGNYSYVMLANSQIPTSQQPAGVVISKALQFTLANVTSADTATLRVTLDSALPVNPRFFTVVGNSWNEITPVPGSVSANSFTFQIKDRVSAQDVSPLAALDSNASPGAVSSTLVIAGDASQGGSPTGTNDPAPASGGKSGCFIATAAFGSYLDPHVMVLRHFRDDVLLQTRAGTAFVKFYYHYSPPVADFIREHGFLRLLARWTLTPLIFAAEYPRLSGLALLLALAGFSAGYLRRMARRSCAPQE